MKKREYAAQKKSTNSDTARKTLRSTRKTVKKKQFYATRRVLQKTAERTTELAHTSGEEKKKVGV